MNLTLESTISYKGTISAIKANFKDLSFWFLLLSNVVTIYLALTEDWDVKTLVLIYWFQFISIGFFEFLKLLFVKDFKNNKIKIRGDIQVTIVWILIFGVISALFLTFILNYNYNSAPFDYNSIFPPYHFSITTILIPIMVPVIIFFLNHAFAYFYFLSSNSKNKVSPISIFIYMHVRIIPIYFILTSSLSIQGSLIFFLILKTVTDLAIHIIQNRNVGDSQNVTKIKLH